MMMARKFWALASVLALAACDCEGSTEELGGADASNRDADASLLMERQDGSERVDVGLADAGREDVGADASSGCAKISAEPRRIVVDESSAAIAVANVGTCELLVFGVAITGPNNDLQSPSADDFFYGGDGAFALGPGETTIVEINYANNDDSPVDLGELHFFSNDQVEPDYFVGLIADDNGCPSPQAVIAYSGMPVVGQELTLDATSSDPGPRQSFASYRWELLFTPSNVTPPFSDSTAPITTFTPIAPGQYVVRLEVWNECGAASTTTETIDVQP